MSSSKSGLSVWQVVIIGIAYMTPMTVFDTFGIVSGVTEGRVPMAYLLALVAVLLTALSYGRLVKLYPDAGSAYSYAKNTCGNQVGMLVGWASLLDYILLPMINSLLSGIYLRSLFPQIPPWTFIFAFTLLVTFINCRNIKLLANLNFILVGLPVFLMGVFIYLVIHGVSHKLGYSHVWTLAPLFNGNTHILPLISGAAILCFSFLGFDAVTTLSGETRNAKVAIPKAIFITALSGGFIFFVVAWFTQLYFPDNSHFKNPTEAMPEIILYVGGYFFQSVFLVAILVNTFASALASHASAARLLNIMGRDRIFPKRFFGYKSPETHSPLYCILFVGGISMTAVFFNLDTAVSLISFGALVAFSSVNISVLIQFSIVKKQVNSPREIFDNIIMPVMGLLSVGVMWFNLDKDAMVFGLAWAALGLAYLIYCKLTNKVVILSDN